MKIHRLANLHDTPSCLEEQRAAWDRRAQLARRWLSMSPELRSKLTELGSFTIRSGGISVNIAEFDIEVTTVACDKVSRPAKVLAALSTWMPARITGEEIGDALELLACENKPTRRWAIILRTIFWIVVHSLHYRLMVPVSHRVTGSSPASKELERSSTGDVHF